MHSFGKITLSLLLLAVIASNASAIVVSGKEAIPFPYTWPAEPCPSIVQPEETAGFEYNNVGRRGGGASGVYLGNGWVLTAKHVGAGDITFGDTTYYDDGKNAHKIENPTGIAGLDSLYTDLYIYRLTEEPDLPAVKIATEPSPVGGLVYYVGYGSKQEEDMSYWTVDSTGDEPVWEPSDTPTYFWGYNVTSVHDFSWGYNRTVTGQNGPTAETGIVNVSGSDLISQKTIFNEQILDSQAVSGDSGGGVFYQEESGDWVLSGIINGAGIVPNQPTLAMVDSATYSTALSFYRDQILDIITPELIPGDANGDGIVDGSDVTILAGNWQQTTDLGFEEGDFNGDGFVDGSDVTILAGNWQYGINTQADLSVAMLEASAMSGDTTVPEPSIWAMLFWLISVACWAYRKKCRR